MITDALTISRIYFLQIKSWSLWFFLHTLIFPLGLIFFIKAIGSNMEPARLAAGATVLSISSIGINATGYWVMMDRFEKRIQIINSLAVHKFSYYLGIVFVSVMQSLINVFILIAILNVFSIHAKMSLALAPAIVATSMLFAVVGITVGKYVKDTSHGSLMMNLLSTGAVFVCPIYYPVNILPAGVATIASLMPHTLIFKFFFNLY